MREVDTEAPVIWPAWCYSGEATIEESSNPSLANNNNNNNNNNINNNNNNTNNNNNNTTPSIVSSKNKDKRKASSMLMVSNGGGGGCDSTSATSLPFTHQLGKMISDRMLNLPMENKKFCDNTLSGGGGGSSIGFYEKNFNGLDFVKSNGNSGVSCVASDLSVMNHNNNNNNSSNSNNNNNNNSNNNNNNNNNTSNSNTNSTNNTNNNNTHIKSERLSPPSSHHQLNGNDISVTPTSLACTITPTPPTTNTSRSRSVTPSSYPGTPPQQQHQHHQHQQNNDMIHKNSSISSGGGGGGVANISGIGPMKNTTNDFQPRNYSDFIRSLAAKYNNTNPNEPNNVRNSLFNTRFAINNNNSNTITNNSNTNESSGVGAAVAVTNTIAKDSPSPPECKRLPPTPPQVPNPNNLMTSIFPGISFPSTVFSPLIDMSSTQALVTLARAAKEAEIQNYLKSGSSGGSISQTSPQSKLGSLSPNQIPSHHIPLSHHLHSSQQQQQQQQQQHQQHHLKLPHPSSRFQSSTTFSSLNHQPSHHPFHTATSSSSTVTSINLNNKSPSSSQSSSSQTPTSQQHQQQQQQQTTSPLDLSSTPLTKRLKLESPSPNRTSTSSPTGSAVCGKDSSSRSHSRSNLSQQLQTSSSSTITENQSTQLQSRKCHSQSDEVNSWNVNEVCDFVSSIDICAVYIDNFRDQCIDGAGLPLLTEDHLMNSLGMKLGPALKLRSVLAKKLGGPCPCVSCSLASINANSPSANSIPRPSSAESEI